MERQRFKKTLAVSNTVSHRLKKRKSFKRNNNSNNSSFRHLFESQEGKYIFNEDIFDIDRVLSNPSNSASDSVVYLLKTKDILDNNRYICKVTFCNTNLDCINPENLALIEIKMYKLMNKLVDNYITPHVFKIIGNIKQIDKYDLSLNTKQELKKYKNSFHNITAMINETSSKGGKIINLMEFIKYLYSKNPVSCNENRKVKILENIFFQIVYTLETFNIIGIKHNDLHFGNIFIIENERNIIKGNMRNNNDYFSIYNREYEFKSSNGNEYKKVRLENLGFDVRIYDFDRSCKQANNFKFYKGEIKSKLLEKNFGIFNQNNKPNEYLDIFKVLMSFIIYEKYLPEDFRKKIYKCFRKSIYKTKYEYNNYKLTNKQLDQQGKIYNNYFFLRNIPVDKNGTVLIKHTREILNDLYNINNKKENIPTLEKFSVKNIDKKTLADYDSRMKKLILREFIPNKNNPLTLIIKEQIKCAKYDNDPNECRNEKCFYRYKTKKCIAHKKVIKKIKKKSKKLKKSLRN